MLLRHQLRLLTALVLPLAVSIGAGEALSQPRVAAMPSYQQPAGHSLESGTPIVLAQAADSRVTALEEEVRRLTGQMEDLNFQLLQIQDQLRRMQDDNEFRFQQLEGGSGGGGSATPAMNKSERIPDQGGQQTAGSAPDPNGAQQEQGEPPRTLGSITFDENGNVVTSGAGEPVDLLGDTADTDGSVVAALPPSNNPDEIYRNAYEFILSGDYDTAEAGFRQYLDQFPDGPQAADANFWLGEALLAQKRHREAAEVFLQANRSYPSASKAPDMLLKLGVSLAALGQKEVACATFDEIGQRYPGTPDALNERLRAERASAGC